MKISRRAVPLWEQLFNREAVKKPDISLKKVFRVGEREGECSYARQSAGRVAHRLATVATTARQEPRPPLRLSGSFALPGAPPSGDGSYIG